MIIIIALFLVTFLAYCVGINRILGLPPGPPPLPLVGNLLSMKEDIDKVLLDWKARYGGVFTVWLPYPTVIIGDRKTLHEHVYKNGSWLEKKNPVQIMDIMAGGEYGLINEANSMVKEQRKHALKIFHDIKVRSTEFEDTVHNIAQELVTKWTTNGADGIDVKGDVSKAFMLTQWKIAFGSTLDLDDPKFIRIVELQEQINAIVGSTYMMLVETIPSLRKLDVLFGSKLNHLKTISDELNGYLTKEIDAVRESYDHVNEPSCFVESFLAEQKRREKNGLPEGNFNFKQLLGSTASLIGGIGKRSGTILLRMCSLVLAIHPDIQQKLQREMDEVIGQRRVRYEDQKEMPYMHAFIHEIYRLSNELPVQSLHHYLRISTEDIEIEGHHIPESTTILPQFAMVHMDPTEFELPEHFSPERHLNEKGQFVKDSRITPFSMGNRSCLGEILAPMEVFIFIATFVQNLTFSPDGEVTPTIKFINGFERNLAAISVKIQPRN